jgi:hypothetical protein
MKTEGSIFRIDASREGARLLAATQFVGSLCYPDSNEQHLIDRFAESLVAIHAKGMNSDGRSPRGASFPEWATALRNEQLDARAHSKPVVRLRRRMLAVEHTRATYEEAIEKGLPITAVASPAKRIKLEAQTSGSQIDLDRSYSHALETVWSESKPVLHWAMAFFDVWEALATTTVCLTPDWDVRSFVSAAELWIDDALNLSQGYADILERDLGIPQRSMHQIILE